MVALVPSCTANPVLDSGATIWCDVLVTDVHSPAVRSATTLVPTALMPPTSPRWDCDVSPDGSVLLYQEFSASARGNLKVISLSGEPRPRDFIASPFDDDEGTFSPDGRRVAYVSDESGRKEVFVASFPDPSQRIRISSDGGTQPRWSRDGKELYFVSLDSRLMAAKLAVAAGSVEPAAATALFPLRLSGVPKHQYSVGADGRFLVNEVVEDSASSLLTIVVNWRPK